MSSLWRLLRRVYSARDGSDAAGEGVVTISTLACATHRGV